MTTELTNLEIQVINEIKEMLASGQDQIYIGDLSGNNKKLRGVLASLVKKDIIYVDNGYDGLISLLIK